MPQNEVLTYVPAQTTSASATAQTISGMVLNTKDARKNVQIYVAARNALPDETKRILNADEIISVGERASTIIDNSGYVPEYDMVPALDGNGNVIKNPDGTIVMRRQEVMTPQARIAQMIALTAESIKP